MSFLGNIKESLFKKYHVKDLGEVKTIIGWQITRNTMSIKIDQSAFIQDPVIGKNLANCNANVVQMKASLSIDMTEANYYKEENVHTYDRLVRKLMYLSCGIQPNITFAIGQFNRHNTNSKKGHIQVAKRVTQYLKQMIDLGLIYDRKLDSKIPPPFRLSRYIDSNFAEDPEDQKSVIGYYFFFNGAVVSWSSKKHSTISTSITEA